MASDDHRDPPCLNRDLITTSSAAPRFSRAKTWRPWDASPGCLESPSGDIHVAGTADPEPAVGNRRLTGPAALVRLARGPGRGTIAGAGDCRAIVGGSRLPHEPRCEGLADFRSTHRSVQQS